MYRHTLTIAATLFIAASLASAQTPSPTRAEVKAETLKARQAGEMPGAGEQGAKEAPFKPTQTRAERKAKTLAAIKNGEVNSRGEAMPPEKSATVAKGGDKTRADVKAEARAANKSGATRIGESYPDKPR